MQWSPDGRQIGFTVCCHSIDLGPARAAGWTTEVRDADTGTLIDKSDGRVIWLPDGQRVRLTDGQPLEGTNLLVDQRIELLTAGRSIAVSDARSLSSVLPDAADGGPQITGLVTLGDPAYVGVWMARGTLGESVFVVIRLSDGRQVWSLSMTGPTAQTYRQDVTPSPTGDNVAWTEGQRSDRPPDLDAQRVFVADALTGKVTALGSGRVAGWSPDGEWVYEARDEGLFAARVDGSRAVRVGPIGVPVAAARP